VARLELQAPIDPAEAPWPDRENLRAKAQPGSSSTAGDSGSGGEPVDSAGSGPGDGRPGDQGPRDESTDGQAAGDTGHDPGDEGDTSSGGRPSADRSRVIRPAGFKRSDGQAEQAAEEGMHASQVPAPDAEEPAAAGLAGLGDPTLGGPRDYELDEPSDDDLDGDDRYIPPPLPPQPGLDPVAKGAWLALFGGPGYLLIATLLSWQIAGWAALTAVIAFVTGFVVLVFRLGDGPSKRDGPDQGAVV